MGQPYVGQVIAVGFNFTPSGWLSCNGQLLPISEFEVLYTLLGTTYGGDGTSTFAVPDLRGRTPVDAGQGPGLSNYGLGEITGTEGVSLQANQVGSHTHGLMASSQIGTVAKPTNGTALGQSSQTMVNVYGAPPANTSLSSKSLGTSPGGLPHENRQPYVTVNYIICYAGVFPSSS
jgi:microcystin-dependent protein